jgi:hypothetical protein
VASLIEKRWDKLVRARPKEGVHQHDLWHSVVRTASVPAIAGAGATRREEDDGITALKKNEKWKTKVSE